MFPDLDPALLNGFQCNFAVLAHQLAVHKKTVSHRSHGCDMSHVTIDRIQSHAQKDNMLSNRKYPDPLSIQTNQGQD